MGFFEALIKAKLLTILGEIYGIDWMWFQT